MSLRGSGSFNVARCPRRSFRCGQQRGQCASLDTRNSVDFDEKVRVAHFNVKRLKLIAMCFDQRFLGLATSYDLYAQFDLFPSAIAFVELLYYDTTKLSTETRGIYLAIEGVATAIRDSVPDNYLLMRQGYWPSLEIMEPDDVAPNTPEYNYHARPYFEVRALPATGATAERSRSCFSLWHQPRPTTCSACQAPASWQP